MDTGEFVDHIRLSDIGADVVGADASSIPGTTLGAYARTASTNASLAVTQVNLVYNQIGSPAGASVSADIAAVAARTANLPASPAATSDIPTVAQIWTTALTEAYRATGATGTGAQLLYEILMNLAGFVITDTTKTARKLDGSTTAKTYTLNDATTPTGITEAT